MIVKIVPNDKGNPPGKLADAELHFGDRCDVCTTGAPGHYYAGQVTGLCSCGLLAGLKLIGFGIWERRGGGGHNVTFPARQYSINGERRAFALLRPIADASNQLRVRDLILAAYAEYEQQTANDNGAADWLAANKPTMDYANEQSRKAAASTTTADVKF